MNEQPNTREAASIMAFVELADTLVDAYDITDLLDRLARHCVELLAADAAGILLADARQNLQVIASTHEQTEWMELLQLQADEGPCLDCFRSATAVSVADLREAADRWPRFAAALVDHESYRSVHALPLRLRGEPIGALTLFHRRPGALPAADLALGQALADVATIGIISERMINRGETLNVQLQAALQSRIVIEQAKGILAERGGIGLDAAFERLRAYGRDRNMKLADVGGRVINEGLATTVLAGRPARDPSRPGRFRFSG